MTEIFLALFFLKNSAYRQMENPHAENCQDFSCIALTSAESFLATNPRGLYAGSKKSLAFSQLTSGFQ